MISRETFREEEIITILLKEYYVYYTDGEHTYQTSITAENLEEAERYAKDEFIDTDYTFIKVVESCIRCFT